MKSKPKYVPERKPSIKACRELENMWSGKGKKWPERLTKNLELVVIQDGEREGP